MSFLQDAHESDKDDHVEDNPGQEVRQTKTEPERTVQTPAWAQIEMDARQSPVISTLTDGAGRCEPRDSEKEHLGKICSGFAQSWVYPPELNRHVRDLSVPNSVFYSAQVNTLNSCASMDRAAPCGLVAPVRTLGAPRFPVQVHRQPTKKILTKTHEILKKEEFILKVNVAIPFIGTL